jgi:aryl-alcohol dehydrogenase-like predicted oxidoreductase
MLGLGVSERRMIARFAAIQGPYSVAEHGIERELLPMAAHQGLGVVAFGALGSGHW